MNTANKSCSSMCYLLRYFASSLLLVGVLVVCCQCSSSLGQHHHHHQHQQNQSGLVHSTVHNAQLGRSFTLTHSTGDTPPYLEWSNSKQRFEGLLPDLLAAVSDELGMRFAFKKSTGDALQEIQDFVENRSHGYIMSSPWWRVFDEQGLFNPPE